MNECIAGSSRRVNPKLHANMGYVEGAFGRVSGWEHRGRRREKGW